MVGEAIIFSDGHEFSKVKTKLSEVKGVGKGSLHNPLKILVMVERITGR